MKNLLALVALVALAANAQPIAATTNLSVHIAKIIAHGRENSNRLDSHVFLHWGWQADVIAERNRPGGRGHNAP